MKFKENQNKGLPSQITLTEGRFNLVGGQDKCADNISLFLAFLGFFRIYKEDFPPDLLWLAQTTTSKIETFRTLVLGNLTKSFSKYIPFVSLKGVNFTYTFSISKRKTYVLGIEYSYNLEPEQSNRVIRFIQT